MVVQKAPLKAKKAKRVISNPAYKNTEERLRVVVEEYAKHGRVVRACETAGIHFTVHYRRVQNDPVYRAAVEEAEQAAAQRLEDQVYDWAEEGDLQAALALLKRFRPQHYRERASVDVSGSIDLVTALTQARSRMVVIDADPDTRKAG